ncbi:hypothetical protein JXJ21_20435 [candidate division KSB1 bacterium]|nr:hypothetical protein [candidate division KSB1 bacterium]
MKLNLIAKATAIFRTDEVDLVLLNKVPNLLAYEIISDGNLLYEADKAIRITFETRTISTYTR